MTETDPQHNDESGSRRRLPDFDDVLNDTVSLGAETLAYPNLRIGDEGNLGADAVALVEQWLAAAESIPVDPAAARLAAVLRDPNGLAFAVGFVDGVMRPEDPMVAGENLAAVAKIAPETLSGTLRAAISLGGVFGPVLPWIVVPTARKALQQMVGHLVLDASDAKLGKAIARLRANGNRLNINLLGEAVLGDAEASRRLQGTAELLARADVDYVSIKVSSVVAQLSMWDFDGAVERVVEQLTPLYRMAATASERKFINLDMEEYHDLDLTIAVFQRLLDQPELQQLEAGIVLQAYLPDALGAAQRLTEWASARRARGGSQIKVRVVKGANLAMERVDATMHGWPLATVANKQDADTNYKRMLHWMLTQEHTDAVRVGVAGHNLFDIAYAWLLAGARGVREAVDFEMLLGMAPSQAAAVQATVGPLRLYTPVVHPAEFDVAIAYLIRRLEENATSDNFMSAVFELSRNRELFTRERDRFLRSLAELEGHLDAPSPNRDQDRSAEAAELARALEAPLGSATALTKPADAEQRLTSVVLGIDRGSTGGLSTRPGPGATPGFENEPDTDSALAANREWGRQILIRAASSELGQQLRAEASIRQLGELDAIIERSRAAGAAWGARPAEERAALLHRAGIALAAHRAELIEVMASEAGKTIAEGDVEVSEAVDFAHYYAERARELDRVQGARFVPSALTVVTPPWNFPVAIPAGGVLAALAAGSAVILKPARLVARTGAVLAQALVQAGLPKDVLTLVSLDGPGLGEALIGHPGVDRVILTGSYETAELFRRIRPDLALLAETSGKNAIVVTPSADLDLAAGDVIRSAFGHAGQKCSAASLLILVGSVAKSERFTRQLMDAARSMRVGLATEASSQLGPLIEPANGKLLSALTTIGEGESWLLEPRQLDDTGRLWSPGIRRGVLPGSEFHLTEYFGPVLGIMHARNLNEAIDWQNQVAYGLTAGLHSLNQYEIEEWTSRVEAGNLYVNRGITGAIVQRQPFGGWKRSAVGAGAKAGGPNYLFGLGSWQSKAPGESDSLHLRGLHRRVTEIIETAQPVLNFEEFEQLRQACLSDQVAWKAEYSRTVDHSGLGVERNLLRYRALPVAVRIAEDSSLVDGLRMLCAALLSRSRFTLSSGIELPSAVRNVLAARGVRVLNESDDAWLQRLAADGREALNNRLPEPLDDALGGGQGEHQPEAASLGLGVAATTPTRIRLVSAKGAALESLACNAIGGSPDVAIWSHPVTGSGRVELLPFLHEQSLTITAHRFGNPNPVIAALELH